MKQKLFTLLTLLVLCVTGAWADGTINAASTTDLGSGNTPRYVVEEDGVGRLMKNKTGSSSWSVSSGFLTTGSSLFALQTYHDISAIIITGYGTGNNRTLSKVEVGTTTGNYAEVTASSSDKMDGSSAGTSQTMTITPSSTIAADSYVAITFSGNVTFSSVTLVYATATAPDAPTFSPDGGDVQGLTTANIVSEGNTTYYQWSTNASAGLTTASEGWSTGTSAEVPNTDGTYYLYAYASNGSGLNSAVVRSEAFNVTSVVVTAATISWSFNDNTTTAAAVLSAGSEMISGSSVTMGSNLDFESNTDHCYVDSEGNDDVIVSRVKPSSVASSNDLVFSIDLKDGVTFLPTSISFVAMKQGTNGAVTLDAKWYEDGESDIALLTGQALKRASSSGTYAKPGGDRFVIDPSEKSVTASAGTTGLRLVLNNTNSYGIGEIKITGRFIGSPVVPTETYTVTFNAGSNGTCATASLTEDEPGAGVTLPAVTPNSGYGFLGWFTAADGGTKVGDAGDTYRPTEDITIYAQYQEEVAPTISIDEYNPETLKTVAVTLTASTTGAPDPTVTWYQSATATTSGGTSKGTGLTFNPDVTAIGTFYYYAVASNGVSPDATSSLITLTVNDPDKYVDGNAYYVSSGEQAIPNEQIFCDDITMTFVNGKSGESFTTAGSDTYLSGINSNFVASLTGTSGNNGWKARFVPAVPGTLSVGVVINGSKTFSISNVTGFSYVGKQDDGNNETSDVDDTNDGNSMTPTKKIMVLVTIDVVAGTTYDFSVASSKMGFYGFEFTPATEDAAITAAKYATYVPTMKVAVPDGVTAYYVSAATSTKATLVEATVIPANQAVIIYKDVNASTDVTFTATSADASFDGGANELTYSDTDVTADGTQYVLADGSNGVGFYPATTGTIAARKAYLVSPTGAHFLSFDFGNGETTNIKSLEAQELMKNSKVYNLAGQRVAQPTKGLYIVNGRKVVIR